MPEFKYPVYRPHLHGNKTITIYAAFGIAHLERDGIETRPGFPPSHLFPMNRLLAEGECVPTLELLGSAVFNLPSYPGLTVADIDAICDSFHQFFKASSL
jgi:dTDP-4-amino-4,6-dideoxygalactose transaminase